MRIIRKGLKLVFLTMICIPFVYILLGSEKTSKNTITVETEEVTKEIDTDIENNNKIEDSTITIVVTGENFMHDSVIESGKQSDGTYNYDYLFAQLKDIIENADISVLNQGSVIGGNELGVSGYPEFNAPEEVCDATKSAGFDVVLMANNRINTMGTDAIYNCLNIWDKKAENIAVLGINQNEAQYDSIKIIERNGIRFALLNYTYNISTPINDENKYYMVDFLNQRDESTGNIIKDQIADKVLSDINKASEMADYVLVFPYWGIEYDYEKNDLQEKFAKEMIQAGADIIIGSHPHFLQNVEKLTSENGNTGLCYYSLGNYISSQNYDGAMLGGLAKITLNVTDGEITIDENSTGLIPVVTHYTYDGTSELADVKGVYLLKDYTPEMALEHGIIKRGGVEFSKGLLDYIVNQYIDEKYVLYE